MDLHTLRRIRNKSQLDLQQKCGVEQSVLSIFENYNIDRITPEEKTKIEKYLNVKVDWQASKNQDLSLEEEKELRQFLLWIEKAHGERKALKWLQSLDTGREAYLKGKALINKLVVTIPMPEMDFSANK
jgi:transcriptional regulator with XRE-family HTH domain